MAKLTSAAAAKVERQLIEKSRNLVESWAPYLDAPAAPEVKSDVDRYILATALETTKRELTEAGQTTSVFGSSYVSAMLGMIRQVFPRLIGKDIVGIQPLDRPTGKVFKLDIKRDDNSLVDNFESWDTYRSYADFSGAELDPITTGMKLAITDSDVSVGTPKKLMVEASLELLQDLRAYHQIDANDVLQGAAIDEIAREIDAVLVRLVRQAAIAHKTVTFGKNAPTGYTAEEWRKRLQRAILIADNQIYKARGVNATWLVCGADAAMELEDLNAFSASGFSGETASYGLEAIGSLSSRYQVFRSRYVASNEIIVGRKGGSILEAGAFWLPYVPLFVSERVFDPETQGYKQSFMSRYATHTASNQYFARVVIDEAGTDIA